MTQATNCLLIKASRLQSEGQFEAAATCYQRVIKRSPRSAEALLRFGQLRLQQGQHEEAAELISRALNIDPKLPGGATALGITLSNLERIDEAIASFMHAVTQDANDVSALTSLGILFSFEKRPQDAILYFQRAIALTPSNAELHNGLGVAFIELGRFDEAAVALRHAVMLLPQAAESHNNLGIALSRLGNHVEALESLRRATELQADYVDAHVNLAAILQESGTPDGAIQHCETALALQPDLARAHLILANALRALGRVPEAVNHYKLVQKVEPGHAMATLNLGLALAEHGNTEEAIEQFHYVLTLVPDCIEALHGLARGLRRTGRYAEAIRYLERTLTLRPDLAEAHADKGNLLKEVGEVVRARRAIETAISLQPTHAEFYLDLAECKQFTAGDQHIAAMESLAARPEALSDDARIALYFALGKAYADIGDAIRSFSAWESGNALKRRQIDYDEATALAVLEHARAVFSPALLRTRHGAGNPSRVPIFIVGMPRSGSTLVEQILASHPDVHGAGELSAFHDAIAGLAGPDGPPPAYPALVPGLTNAQLIQLGTRYLETLTKAAPTAHRVTDKMLANFRFLGLIHLALPNARIIHTRRHPVDTCLSCFSKLFAGALPFTYDMGELGRYYRGYVRLMAHWREVLPPNVMLEMDYEDIVTDLTGATQRILAHCDLPWDERCLEFHRVDRPVRTASVIQVRQPIYHNAVGRSRDYMPMLQPLLEALGPNPHSTHLSDVRPMFVTAQALHQNRQADEAEHLYRELLQIDPTHASALHNLGVLRLNAGSTTEAISLLRETIRLQPDLSEGYYNLGLALQASGDQLEAVAAFQQAIDGLPDPAAAANGRGVSFLALGKLTEAAACFDQAITARPEYADAYSNRASIFLATNKPAEAIAECRKALACRPDFAEAYYNLGLALQLLGKSDEASEAFLRVLELNPNHWAARRNLGRAFQTGNRYAQAIAQFEQMLKVRPDDAETWSNLGTALREIGRLDDARHAFEQAVAIAPRYPLYFRQLGECRRFESEDIHLSAMQSLAETLPALTVAEQTDLHFALGKAYADLGQHQNSFRHLLAGNALHRQQIIYDEAATLAVFDRIRSICSPALLRAKAGGGDPSCLPVFIVGMPRSGSTLVEQILACHPQVFGAGELLTFERAMIDASAPDGSPRKFMEALPDDASQMLALAGGNYVAAVSALAPQAARVVDKMPPNFLFIGAIHLTLPNARIIHTRRNPVDTCLSCFSKLFAGDLPHTYDLGELGRYYRSYERLMAHWRAVLPQGVMLEVDYEEVVANLESEARRIIAHCGLDWHSACLEFHLSDRPVRTASATAVRQKLYRDAVGRWRPYAQMLRPLLDALDAR